MRKLASILFIVIILALLYTRLQSSKNAAQNTISPASKVRVTCGIWAGYGPIFIGIDQKFFKDLDVSVNVIDDVTARHALYSSGQAEIIATTIDGYAYENIKGIKGNVFLLGDHSFGADGIIARTPIKTVEDLKGKKVAFPRVVASHYLLYKALQSKDLSMQDINRLETDDPSTAVQALAGGSCDAAVSWEPYLSQVKEKSGDEVSYVATSRDFSDAILDIFVASPTFSQQPDLMQKFIDGWYKGIDFVQANPDQAAEIIAKGFNVSKEEAKGMLDGLRFIDKKESAEFFKQEIDGSSKLSKMLDEAGTFWVSEKVISQATSGKDLILPQVENLLK